MGVLIVGMHRSGTSAVAGVLEELGLNPGAGSTWELDSGNFRGLHEWQETAAFNDEWLESLGGSWSAPPRMTESSWSDLDLRHLAESRRRLQYFRGDLRNWYVKDPRISLLIPLWDRLTLQRCPMVIVVRSPRAVAESLRLRSGFYAMRSMALWWEYYRAILEAVGGRPTIVVQYEELLADPEKSVAALAAFLQEQGFSIRDDWESATAALDAGLNRQTLPATSPFEKRLLEDLNPLQSALRDSHLGAAPESLLPLTDPEWVEEVMAAAAEFHREYERSQSLERLSFKLEATLAGIEAGGSYRLSKALSTIASVVRRGE